jgi:hypothetical protein
MIPSIAKFYPFAYSIAEAKSQPTTEGRMRPGMIVAILNAINPNQLSFYVYKFGAHADSLPSIFNPTDNTGNFYYEVTT